MTRHSTTRAHVRPAVSALAVATAVLAALGTAGGSQPASASTHATTASPSSAPSPHPRACNPQPGTILSSKATSDDSSWLPSSVYSAFSTGPGWLIKTVTRRSTVGTTLSARFTVDESMLFASAKQSYGVSLGTSVSRSGSWAYRVWVPAHHTAKMQQWHQGWEIGIRQVYVTDWCTRATESSTSGNFFNAASTSNNDYCYSVTVWKNPPIEVRYTCDDQL